MLIHSSTAWVLQYAPELDKKVRSMLGLKIFRIAKQISKVEMNCWAEKRITSTRGEVCPMRD
ncbi:hypothetical protein UP17_01570 [Peribacillus simplex]|nr:hypothetical protein UP17_01570 [Peribacillus simplex]